MLQATTAQDRATFTAPSQFHHASSSSTQPDTFEAITEGARHGVERLTEEQRRALAEATLRSADPQAAQQLAEQLRLPPGQLSQLQQEARKTAQEHLAPALDRAGITGSERQSRLWQAEWGLVSAILAGSAIGGTAGFLPGIFAGPLGALFLSSLGGTVGALSGALKAVFDARGNADALKQVGLDVGGGIAGMLLGGATLLSGAALKSGSGPLAASTLLMPLLGAALGSAFGHTRG